MQRTETLKVESASTFESQISNESLSLLDLIEIIVRRWRMIVVISFIASIIVAIITMFMPNIYTAKAMVIPGDDDKSGLAGALMAQLGGLANLAGAGAGSKSTGDLYITMLKSESLKDPLVNRFKLMDIYKKKLRADTYAVLGENTNISLGKKDGVVSIMVDDKDPKLAAALANGYVEELGKLVIRLNMTGAGNNSDFLEKRLSEAKTDLSKAEEDLKAFQAQNKVISVTDQAQATIGGIAQLKAQLAMQEVQLATLQSQFTDSSQEVKAVKATIANLRGQISSMEGKGGASSSIPSVGSMPQLGQDYVRLMREFKVQEAIFEMLTKQYEISQLNKAKDVAPFQVLQQAKVPEKKSKPVRSTIVLLSGLATAFVLILVVIIHEFSQRMGGEDRERWRRIKGHLPAILGNFGILLGRMTK